MVSALAFTDAEELVLSLPIVFFFLIFIFTIIENEVNMRSKDGIANDMQKSKVGHKLYS